MKKIIIYCGIILLTLSCLAQSKRSEKHNVHLNSNKEIEDTLKEKSKGQEQETLTTSDFMISIERVNDELNTIRDSSRFDLEIERLEESISSITKDLELIRENIGGRNTIVNIKNIYLYQNFLSSINKRVTDNQRALDKMYTQMSHAKVELKTVLEDSIYLALCADSVAKINYTKQLRRLTNKWRRTDSTVRVGLGVLNDLKVKASDNSMTTSNMIYRLQRRLDKSSTQLFGKEINYIWELSTSNLNIQDTVQKASSKFRNEQKAINYYLSKTSNNRTIILVLAILLFGWYFVAKRQIVKRKDSMKPLGTLNLKYMNSHPILSIIVILLCLMPFFDAYAPIPYIAYEYIILLLISSVIFFKKWTHYLWLDWIVLSIILILILSTNMFIEPVLFQRIWLLFLHSSIIIFVVRFVKKINKQISLFKWIQIAAIVSILLAFMGIIANLFGRFSLSEILGVTSILCFNQMVILSIFYESIIEIVLIQLLNSRVKKGFNTTFDCLNVIKSIKTPLLIVVLLLWGILLISNLNIYHDVNASITNMLTMPRTVGSITFKLSSILLFVIIIWIAHILQKLISFLFGEVENEQGNVSTMAKGQHSRIMIMRLVVLCVGYFLAIAASGLPMDKITIVIGALGVGIGMGLQTIVNNLVSGIILIFDGTLKIGDEIEINGQGGWVKEINLRSSTLRTADGAEVIIPNGTILSRNIVNWTYSNDHRRVEVAFSLTGKELDANLINEIVNTTLSSIANITKDKKSTILFTKVHQETCWLTVRFWSSTAYVEQVKSEALLKLSTAFQHQKITME